MYFDNVRRVLRAIAATDEKSAVAKVLKLRAWEGFDLDTVQARELVAA